MNVKKGADPLNMKKRVIIKPEEKVETKKLEFIGKSVNE